MNPDWHYLYDTLLLINGVVLDLVGDTATGPHLDPAWIPAFAGMTAGAELACGMTVGGSLPAFPRASGLGGSESLYIPSKVNSY